MLDTTCTDCNELVRHCRCGLFVKREQAATPMTPDPLPVALPELPTVAYRFSVPGLVKLDVWPHGGAWEKLVRKSDAEAALRAQAEEVAALRADAERYRWLKEHTVVTGLSRFVHRWGKQFLDDTIDVHLASKQEKPHG